ncbi:type VI secretion system-associated FHA domain protein TagH [Caulobacter sp. 1776]|uniref:type VI secretion system-associated FHA domain protein TagH n=1 Tax=Caulobacter sp. 1776 TaxID=3156420 RepID=UPI003391383C
MTLVLTIKSLDRLDNGESARLTLDRHGARIGRSPHMDWCLPDPRSYISSSHCEIEYHDGAYLLVDRSTNGTFVNRSTARLSAPHRIDDGDVILIGHYEIEARLDQAAANDVARDPQAWSGWDSHGGREVVGDPGRWDQPAPRAAITGQGAAAGAWAPPRVQAEPQPASAWAVEAPQAPPPSAWSSEPSAPAAPTADDVWGRLAVTNEVDWDRGFAPAPVASPVAAPSPAAPAWDPRTTAPSTPAQARAAPAPIPPRGPQPASGSSADWNAFLGGAGLEAEDFRESPQQVLATAGGLLRRLMGGLVVMLEARARAKAQLGAQGTALEFDGNNPLKFTRSADRALAQMLNRPDRGFMPSDRAVEDAFRDLQAHQMATLSAMQGALAATLDRFSPSAIRGRAENKGLLAKILPRARDAALWQAYEREFEGVTRGSDEAFMEVFAKEFRDAYERIAADMKAKAKAKSSSRS